MTIKVRGMFDGKVFIPEHPVDLPIGQAVDIQIVELSAAVDSASFRKLIADWSSEPVDADVPTDLASQVDHYLYGTPKQKD